MALNAELFMFLRERGAAVLRADTGYVSFLMPQPCDAQSIVGRMSYPGETIGRAVFNLGRISKKRSATIEGLTPRLEDAWFECGTVKPSTFDLLWVCQYQVLPRRLGQLRSVLGPVFGTAQEISWEIQCQLSPVTIH